MRSAQSSYRDRTQEFQNVAERLKKSLSSSSGRRKKKSFSSRPGPALASNAETTSSGGGTEQEEPRSAVAVQSEFNKRSSKIGDEIHQTSQKLAKLAKLAKTTLVFDDPTVEIQELTSVIKQDITALNSAVVDLQLLCNSQNDSGNFSNDTTGHATTVIDNLKNRLMNATKELKEFLISQTENLKVHENRRQLCSATPSKESTNPFVRQCPLATIAASPSTFPPPWVNESSSTSQLFPSLDGSRIARCTYLAVTVAIALFDHTKYLDICKELCLRLKGLKQGSFELTYSYAAYKNCLLQCDMDVRLMNLSLSLEKLSFVDILVSDVILEREVDDRQIAMENLETEIDDRQIVMENLETEIDDRQIAMTNFCSLSESSNVDDNEYLENSKQEKPGRYASYEWRFYIKEIGQKFEGGLDEFRLSLLKYSVEIGFGFVFIHNDKDRVTAECFKKFSDGCGWRVHASRCSANGFFYIRSMNNVHTCKGVIREQKAMMMCSKIVASVVIDLIRNRPSIKPSEIKSLFKVKYGFDISYYNAWYGKELANHLLHGDKSLSFRQLSWYVDSLMSMNPGSNCLLECDAETSRFKRLFICFGGCIEGFKYCRPLLFLDGTLLKGKYKGQLLAATGKNGNQGSFPLAFAIVDSEKEENWKWFMENLDKVLAPQGRTLTYISDRCKGLIEAVKNVCPAAHHGFCYFHLKENLLSKFPASFGKQFRDRIVYLFIKCAFAPTVDAFEYHMKSLKAEGGKRIENFLENLPLKNWANAYFEGNRYGEMCNYVDESFKAWILQQGSMSIYYMVDGIRIKLMNMYADRSRDADLWNSYLCPEIEKELEKTLDVGKHWSVSWSDNELFEVQCDRSVKVSLKDRFCSCGQWKLKGFPCAHALVAIQKDSGNIFEYIEDYFKAENFRKAYSFPIFTITDIEKGLQDVPDDFVVMPPISKKQAGRPRSKRSRFDCDGAKSITCGKCGDCGSHNKRTCPAII